MRLKWISVIGLLAMLLCDTTVAMADDKDCKVVKDRDALDAFMQGIGGAGAFVMLVAPAEVRWIKTAAALGLSSAIWNAAKSYFGYDNQGYEVCKKPPSPGQSAPSQVYLGPQPGLVEHLYDVNALSKYTQFPSGQQTAPKIENPIEWSDPCISLSPPSFCSILHSSASSSLLALGGALGVDQVWDITWTIGGIQYSAKLVVTTAKPFGKFDGYIDVSFFKNSHTARIREDAEISVSGSRVSISCSNANYLEGSGVYDEDTFEFTMNSLTEGQGTVRNAKVSASATLRQS